MSDDNTWTLSNGTVIEFSSVTNGTEFKGSDKDNLILID